MDGREAAADAVLDQAAGPGVGAERDLLEAGDVVDVVDVCGPDDGAVQGNGHEAGLRGPGATASGRRR
ncbi:hypothetical protein GCM10009623_10330 [Nocardioides aestuarii]